MKPSDLYQFLKTQIMAGNTVMVKGAPGVGKSDIIGQVCRDLGVNLIIEHPAVADPTDYKGMPYASDGKAMFLPFGNLEKIINATERTVYFLDDLGQAAPAVQKATMQLLQARRINGHKVADCVTFISATNGHLDRAGVTGLFETVKSRHKTIIELTTDMNDWVPWALKAGLPTELIAFIRFRPGLLHDFQPTNELKNSPCPRTVEAVGRLFQAGVPAHLEYEVYSGAAGEGFASEFMGFLNIFRNLPNPDVVLMKPQDADVPEDPATLYAICGALAHRANENNMERLVTYANRLPKEFSVLLVRDSHDKHPEIANTRAFIDWATTHNDVMI